ncbi:MAG: hypothetical protein OWU84_10355 [Firmicutes bacterium]|nr:hypothetical protein [Bacillota bacterium]
MVPPLSALYPHQDAWVIGGHWEGPWEWLSAARYPDRWCTAEWLGLQQQPDFAALPWLAVDWDNKEGDAHVARRIRQAARALAQEAARHHVVSWQWPSRTALKVPQSAACHQFFWFPDGSWLDHAKTLAAWLSRALEQPVDWQQPEPRYALWGLDPAGHFFFPDPAQGAIVMSIMPMAWLHPCLQAFLLP